MPYDKIYTVYIQNSLLFYIAESYTVPVLQINVGA
jgi:hypothetical protein